MAHDWFNKPVLIRFVGGAEREILGHFHSINSIGISVWLSTGKRQSYERVDIKSVTRLYERPIPWVAKPPLGRMEIRVRIGYMARKNRLSGRERKLLIFEGNLIWVRDGWLKVRYKESEMTETIHQDNIVSFKFV